MNPFWGAFETFYNFQMKKVMDTLKDNFDKIEKV